MSTHLNRLVIALAACSAPLGAIGSFAAQLPAPMYPGLPSETPAEVQRPAVDSDFDLRVVMHRGRARLPTRMAQRSPLP